jgi:hypothetical protein
MDDETVSNDLGKRRADVKRKPIKPMLAPQD